MYNCFEKLSESGFIMQTKDNIIIKGKKEGLEILLPATKTSFNMIFEDLQKKLEKNEAFFDCLNNVNVVHYALSPQNLNKISDLLKNKLHAVSITFSDKAKKENKHAEILSTDRKSLYLKETVRSGQKVEFDGNIILLGDVNAGGEVIASGDIIIMGTLRGLAHAGAFGDEKSIVAASQLQPVQLRIGNLIAVSPDRNARSPYAEIARAKNGLITIEPLNK